MDLEKFFNRREFGKKEMPNLEFIKELQEKLKQNHSILEDGQYTLDRYEGEYAVLENRSTKKMVDVKRKEIPESSKEGDILEYEKGAFTLDRKATEEAKQEVEQLMRQFKKNK